MKTHTARAIRLEDPLDDHAVAVVGTGVVAEGELRPEARTLGAGGDAHRYRPRAGDRVGGELLANAFDDAAALGQRDRRGLDRGAGDASDPPFGTLRWDDAICTIHAPRWIKQLKTIGMWPEAVKPAKAAC
ncbi:MAG: hypothetical protein E6Q92_10420 [Burkholderiaceae bacterium]|nr:MAG: hypothetical protein E6Q92_10420 [Burkholderiaceae bacterium]